MNRSLSGILVFLVGLVSACVPRADEGRGAPGPGGLLFELEDAVAWLAPGAETPRPVQRFPGGGRNGLSWAPDRRRFAFASNHDDGWRLHVGDVDGGSARAGDFREDFILDAAWAPVGEWIAYEWMGSGVGTGGVAVVNAASGVRRALTPPGAHDGELAWLPDGRRLAVAATLSSEVREEYDVLWVERRSALEVVDVASGARERLVALDTEAYALSVSPDGETLLYVAGGALWSVSLGAGARPRRLADLIANHVRPAFSPDGRSIAAVERRPEPGTRESLDVPCVRGPDGTWIRYRPRGLVAHLAWSPDGETLALTDGDGLFLLDRDGGERAVPVDAYEFQSGLDWR